MKTKDIRAEAKRILVGFEEMTDDARVALAKRLNARLVPTDAEAVALAEILATANLEGKLHLYEKSA